MALLFEEDNRRLQCSCGNRRIYKNDVFTYVRSVKDPAVLEENLIETELRCCKCNGVVHIIKPGRDKILS